MGSWDDVYFFSGPLISVYLNGGLIFSPHHTVTAGLCLGAGVAVHERIAITGEYQLVSRFDIRNSDIISVEIFPQAGMTLYIKI
jgi:hypothetical protein